MKKQILILIVCMILLVFPVYGDDGLVIHKVFDKNSYNVGDTVRVKLEVRNTLGKEVQMFIQDKTILGGTGYDTVCEKGIIGAGSGIVNDYKSFVAHEPGNYSVEDIRYRYVDPVNGQDVFVEYDEPIEIEVKGEKDSTISISQISTLENCVFDEDETEKEQEEGEQQESEEEKSSMEEKMKEQIEKIKDMMNQKSEDKDGEKSEGGSGSEMSLQEKEFQNKKSNIQQSSSQDMNAAKKRLEDETQKDEMQKQKELDDVSKALENSKEFEKLENEMKDEQFSEKDMSVEKDYENNKTEFTKEYENADGEKGNITGEVDKDGEVSNLKKITEEDVSKADELLEKNEDYQDMKKQLEENGFVKESEKNEATDKGGLKKSEEFINPETNETQTLESEIIPKEETLEQKIKTAMDKANPFTKDEKEISEEIMEHADKVEKMAEDLETGVEVNESRDELDNELESISDELEDIDDKELSEEIEKKIESVKNEIERINNQSMEESEKAETLKNISRQLNELSDTILNKTKADARSIRIDEESKINVELDDGKGFVEKYKWQIVLLILLLFAYLYARRGNGGKDGESLSGVPFMTMEKKQDFKKNALSLIKKSERLYKDGRKKEAYSKVSEAVRYYLKYKYAPNEEELTSSDAIRALRSKGVVRSYINDTKECLSMCDLVKFAKYRPNDKDFGKIKEIGRKLIQ